MLKYSVATSGAFTEEFVIKPYRNGLLRGLKFAVKDCIAVQGKSTGFGNPTWLATHPAAASHAVCIELLLANGATCIGKTVMDEFAYSLIGENHFYGTPINPLHPDRVPGGSSSGSASAVACGLVDFALGTDTGGSVRVPAANCGIYGYRPTHDHISVAGVTPLAPSFDTLGVLAKNMETLRSVSATLLGTTLNNNLVTPKFQVVQEALDGATVDIQELILNYLDQNVHDYTFVKLAEIASPEVTLTWLSNLYRLIHSCEAWSTHGSWLEAIKPGLGPIADFNFNHIAKKADRTSLPEGIANREWFSQTIFNHLSHDTILCFPTVPEIAPKKGFYTNHPEARSSGGYFQKLVGINAIAVLSRSPQITIPICNIPDMPSIGLSFMAARNQDDFLFKAVSSILIKPRI